MLRKTLIFLILCSRHYFVSYVQYNKDTTMELSCSKWNWSWKLFQTNIKPDILNSTIRHALFQHTHTHISFRFFTRPQDICRKHKIIDRMQNENSLWKVFKIKFKLSPLSQNDSLTLCTHSGIIGDNEDTLSAKF